MRFRTDSPADLRRYSAVLALLLIATSSPADTGQTAISEGAEVVVPAQVPKDEDLEAAGDLVEVNLVDRGKFEHPLLVGRSFLSQGVLVDSAARHRVPPACDKRRTKGVGDKRE